ncbi:MAG TPA: bifunctional precorrin-2 dehydrogenase/sirohydrochlorin ferrochelatase [Chloroflexota bacterium]
MTHSYYPIALDLQGRRCLVVGGGDLATEKVEGLLVAGATIAVVSPEVTATIAYLAEAGEITLYRRVYDAGDLDGVYLAYGATEDRAENARVAADARQAGVLVNAVDDIPNCDFFAVSIVRRGDLQIAISTNGRSPAFARWMREYLDAWLPKQLGGLLDALAEVRGEIKARGPVPPYKRWKAAIDPEVERGGTEGTRERLHAALSTLANPVESAESSPTWKQV